ncbi:uncharacterized protein conserved in bacteria [Hahella chejuensis KCTC 2396]|uniref:Uncharacterized protein conserved in bacteria n=1 Tax=Hahella chejuensis (strain KCTC 2396) TaxID=349521 RepID=Q2S6Q4_HAHCH|nr:DUF2169 domain-containing protein [Hahella chejuensis]ABC33670.1 uncharacterized protein conserved in bacteria [Hahella chejuensis KCTC 2396]
MAQPNIVNHTPFVVEPLFFYDERNVPIVTVAVKASCDIVGTHHLRFSEQQAPLCLAGEYWGAPETASYKYEPEAVPLKLTTDVVLVGHAVPEKEGDSAVKVGVKVGPVSKIVQVYGNRLWDKVGDTFQPTPPQPIERIPLNYEHAFGGRDPRVPEGEPQYMSTSNPVGKGYMAPGQDCLVGMPLPNLEDPRQLIQSWRDQPSPAGFGFISPHWLPRTPLAGTYDEEWQRTRAPLYPSDFDRRFFNAGSPGLVAAEYLSGGEDVVVINASERGALRFALPGLAAPRCKLSFHDANHVEMECRLDTLIINTDEHQVFLIWRAYAVVPEGHQHVAGVSLWLPRVDVLAGQRLSKGEV